MGKSNLPKGRKRPEHVPTEPDLRGGQLLTPPGEEKPLERPRIYVFDGHRFPVDVLRGGLPFLEMAYRARRGEASAVALLTAFKVIIPALDDVMYWPPPAGANNIADTEQVRVAPITAG